MAVMAEETKSKSSDDYGARSKSSKGSVTTGGSKSMLSRESATQKAKQKKKSVRFHDIQIRDYERTVGDNPSCSSGPPIA